MEVNEGSRVVSEAGWAKQPQPTMHVMYKCTYAPLHLPWQRTHHDQREITATVRKKGWEGGRKYAAGKKARVYNVRAAQSALADNVGRGSPRQLSSMVERQATAPTAWSKQNARGTARNACQGKLTMLAAALPANPPAWWGVKH